MIAAYLTDTIGLVSPPVLDQWGEVAAPVPGEPAETVVDVQARVTWSTRLARSVSGEIVECPGYVCLCEAVSLGNTLYSKNSDSPRDYFLSTMGENSPTHQEMDMPAKVIYGTKAVQEALRGARSVNRIYVARESRAHGIDALLDQARAQGVPFDFVPQAKLNDLCDTREHQGIAATMSPIEYHSLDTWLRDCPTKSLVVVLDQIQHPKNLGMILRAALGAGCGAAIAPNRGGALVDDSVLRASAGAALNLPLLPCNNVGQALRDLKEAGFWVYGLDASAEQSVFDTRWADRTALVLGNETTGIRPGVTKACDVMVGIPLANELDSLNVAVAAGISLFSAAQSLSLLAR